MKKPSAETMVIGHPVVTVPLTLLSGLGLLGGFHTGSVLFVIISIGIIAKVQSAGQQARAYRAWKTEWDGLNDNSPKRPGPLKNIVEFFGAAVMLVAIVILWPKLTHGFGHAYHWMRHEHWLLLGLALVGLALLLQFVRCYPRRPKAAKPVTVIAKPILPLPSLADAYRTLPPYCQHLLRGRP